MVTVWSRSDIACRTLDVGNVTDKFERERFKFKPFAKCERATNLYGFSAFNLKDTLINFFVAVGSPSVKPNFFFPTKRLKNFFIFSWYQWHKARRVPKPNSCVLLVPTQRRAILCRFRIWKCILFWLREISSFFLINRFLLLPLDILFCIVVYKLCEFFSTQMKITSKSISNIEFY